LREIFHIAHRNIIAEYQKENLKKKFTGTV